MDSYDQLPDTVAVVVDWPPGLPPFAFIVETADLWQPNDPADFDLPLAAAVFAFEILGVGAGGAPVPHPETAFYDGLYRPAQLAWVTRGRPPVGVGARITVTVPGQPSVAHEIVSVDGPRFNPRVGWSPVDA